jgi:hypothetical protein
MIGGILLREESQRARTKIAENNVVMTIVSSDDCRHLFVVSETSIRVRLRDPKKPRPAPKNR